MMTSAVPMNADAASQALTWQCPSLAEFPPEAIECFREGVGWLQTGDAGAALAPLSRSTELAPAFAEAHIFLGLANALSSNIYPALDHLELAIRLQPDSFMAHFTLAQLNFKLRRPQKGYEAAEQALRCVHSLEERKMLTQLLSEERARARNGLARPWFNKPFSTPALFLAGSGLAAAVMAVLVHLH